MAVYQLVLQWPASSIEDYDALIEIEDVLIETLTGSSKIDGHDAGSGQANIFIRTNEPYRTFEEIKSVLMGRDAWRGIRAAYRNLEATKYEVLWPKGLADFKIS
jgi:hypothetical protein